MPTQRDSHYLSPGQRAAIYGFYLAGRQYNASCQDIANLYPELTIDKSTVYRIVQHYKKYGDFDDTKKRKAFKFYGKR